MTGEYTKDEVAGHSSATDCWIILHGKVYDVTSFVDAHPGGRLPILRFAGKDASSEFDQLHNARVLQKFGPKLLIGTVKGVAQKKRANKDDEFGELVPFGDPYWYQRFKSPYYKKTHIDFRQKVRDFVEKEMEPYIQQWDEAGTYPKEFHEKAYKAGVYGSMWPKEFGGTPPEDCDTFHDLILWDELARAGGGGILAATFLSMSIALPPIIQVGSDEIKKKVVRSVIEGKKIICLAITEPYAGSDVANLRTTAVRDKNDPNVFLVNGEKKFITSGVKADFYVVAARTGKKGMFGISLILLEKGMPGITARRQKTTGWLTSNTAYLTFEDVRVPVSNIIGQENAGFLPIMHQFNHERFIGMVGANRASRVCMEEAIKYARKRKTFGMRLIDHQVIRHKVAEMARKIESTHAFIEQVAYQLQNGMDQRRLGALTALGKVQASKTMEFCAREASQIFGGNSYIRGGLGEKVERISREVRVNAVGGGSEEIMMELAMRQSKL